jgi:hypothetical protein
MLAALKTLLLPFVLPGKDLTAKLKRLWVYEFKNREGGNTRPVLFANQLRAKFDKRNAVILVASDWRVKLHARFLRLMAKDARVAMMAAVAGSLHLVVTHAEKLHIILWGMQHGFYRDAMHALNAIGPEDSELWPLLALVCALRISDLNDTGYARHAVSDFQSHRPCCSQRRQLARGCLQF